jgi:hypothetical protein
MGHDDSEDNHASLLGIAITIGLSSVAVSQVARHSDWVLVRG